MQCRDFSASLAAALALAVLSGSPARGDGSFIKAPCAENAASGGAGVLRTCAEHDRLVHDALTKLVDQKLACFYQQKDADLSKPAAPGQGACSNDAKPFETPCNLAVGEVSAPKPTFSPNFTSCGSPSFAANQKIYASGTAGTLEQAYFHGAYLQALRSCRAAVLGEVHSKRGFDAGSCGMSPATDYGNNLGALTAQGATLSAMGALKESVAIESYCKDDGSGGQVSPDEAKHRMAVCHLSAARAYTEAMFNHMAQCEIFARWERVWRTGLPKLTQALHDGAGSYCSDWAQQNSPDHTFGWCDVYCMRSKNPDEIQAAFNQCYRKKLPEVFKAALLQIFPNDGSGCGPLGGAP